MPKEQVTMVRSIVSRTFYSLGAICSVKQFEVLFTIITATAAMLTYVDWNREWNHHELPQEYLGVYYMTMTILQLLAVLYNYKQFKTIYDFGSNLLLGFAILHVFLSSCIFVCSVLFFFNVTLADIRDSFFIFFLLIDLDKASYLSRCALRSTTYDEVKTNIAEGVSHLGPSMTLDRVLLALSISIPIWAGITKVTLLCQFGLLAIIIHFISMLTIYPAFISLHLEALSRSSSPEPQWLVQIVPHRSEANIFNPVTQGVKKIMSAGLIIVHGIKSFSDPDNITDTLKIDEPPIFAKVINTERDYIALLMFIIALLTIVRYLIKGLGEDLTGMDNLKVAVGSVPSQSVATQTESEESLGLVNVTRTIEECLKIYKSQSIAPLTNDECLLLINKGHLRQRELEDGLKDCQRAVEIRRDFYKSQISNPDAMNDLPYLNYDYTKVKGRCCENVIGYSSIPVGLVGPFTIDGVSQYVPLSTTEGALVASVSRGCKALGHAVDGIRTGIYKDGMTRAPMIQLPTAIKAGEVMRWVNENFDLLKQAFESTSNYAQLDDVHVALAGRMLHLRFVSKTMDAMGMNMVTKGSQKALALIKRNFDDVEIMSISGNFCTDKKHSAVNWILGRGKSVVCEAVIPGDVVKSVLKTDCAKLVDNNIKKNYVGAALAGSIGGNNCHASNIVAAIFIATGQDPAQVMESASCLTMLECWGKNKEDLYVNVTMPSLCVGTVGGGTGLDSQIACLRILNIQGPSPNSDGENACKLASAIAATVMAGELSLLASLTDQTLVKSHMALNRRTNPCT